MQLLFPFLTLASLGLALPSPHVHQKPPIFLLAGDSTTATQAPNGGNGGGWGDGFINSTLHRGATGLNYGHNGATTVSFRQGGDWDTVLAKVAEFKSDYAPVVTIQFGHNDQKPAKNISVADYTTNLETFVAEVRKAGATPILVTPLSRRGYDNSTGVPLIIENLEEQRVATIAAAKKTKASYIDLTRASTRYLNSIGPANADTYNQSPEDRTHINVAGSLVFGGMVAGLIGDAIPQLEDAGFVKVDRRLERALARGEYYWP